MFVKQIKTACLEFRQSHIDYKGNDFDQGELVSLNTDLLMQLQSNLASYGVYDEFFRSHEGEHFYVKPLIDFMVRGQMPSDIKRSINLIAN